MPLKRLKRIQLKLFSEYELKTLLPLSETSFNKTEMHMSVSKHLLINQIPIYYFLDEAYLQ